MKKSFVPFLGLFAIALVFTISYKDLSNWMSGTIIGDSISTTVTTGNLIIGDGTPTVALDGEDAYVEGTLEVDGNVRFDGDVTLGTTSEMLFGSNAGGSTTNGAVWWNGTNFLGYTGSAQVQLDNTGGGSAETLRFFVTDNDTATPFVVGDSDGASTVPSQKITFQSFGADNIYAFFPGYGSTSGSKTIQTTKYYIYNRTGAYAGNSTFTLKIYNQSGVLQHTVSTSSIDLEAVAPNVWGSVSITGVTAYKTIDTGEYAVFHFNNDSGFTNDLTVELFLELVIQ